MEYVAQTFLRVPSLFFFFFHLFSFSLFSLFFSALLVSDPPSPRHAIAAGHQIMPNWLLQQFIVSVNGAFNRIPFYS